ncbi:hypothetical protein SERLA73DRAFT_181423 [Serpula lacrymans var. lacrymans S7.3]|uniref:Uncharacterized protein n=1 Tax=Serpula lacrymans var. lacrymans (strain S7.3) TaxID=936435 RepID=F8PY21_SERL3|nr:hypothetical protein SERLA73DRAFT_181423 [Serpula lacrymans var. lacrymans S7.3]
MINKTKSNSSVCMWGGTPRRRDLLPMRKQCPVTRELEPEEEVRTAPMRRRNFRFGLAC